MNSKYKNIITAICFSITLVFTACVHDEEFEGDTKATYSIDMTGEIVQGGQNLLVVDENNPANKYCRIDSTLVYGFGTTYFIPDSLKDSELKVIITGKLRESENANSSVAVTILNTKDSTLFWDVVYSKKYIASKNTWVAFKDSLIIPKSQNNLTSKILKIFPFKNQGAGYFDVDDLTITIVKE